ncbi:MAG: thiol:disulfide interchange protein DsbC [Campylobacterota bacterium]|nr:thiol:disulfide interchange protein DsbC [Campylobacterota bacterium]
MIKITAAILLSVNLLYANNDKEIADFVKNNIRKGDGVEIKSVTVSSVVKTKDLGDWEAVILKIDLEIDKNKQSKYEILFRKNNLMAFDVIDIKTRKSIKDSFSPPFESKYYKKDRIIAGDKSGNAKHKIVIFSDPLCPFCLDLTPDIISFVKKHPNDISLYFYHLPLESLHPSSPTIIKAALALEESGYKDVVEKLYKAEFDPKIIDEEKILKAFNEYFKTTLTKAQINTDSIKKHLQEDVQIASSAMVRGTPTVYIDGKKDDRGEAFDKLKKKLEK